MKAFLAIVLLGAAWPCWSLSSEAREFMSITQQLEPMQCEKRKLRRAIALAEIERQAEEARALRQRFAALDRNPQTAKLERRLGELEPRVARSGDPQDLAAISHQQREAFYRCE